MAALSKSFVLPAEAGVSITLSEPGGVLAEIDGPSHDLTIEITQNGECTITALAEVDLSFDAAVDRTVEATMTFSVELGDPPTSGPGILAGPFTTAATGHRYHLLGASSWTDAEVAARALGGHLVAIGSQEEQDIVRGRFAPLVASDESLRSSRRTSPSGSARTT